MRNNARARPLRQCTLVRSVARTGSVAQSNCGTKSTSTWASDNPQGRAWMRAPWRFSHVQNCRSSNNVYHHCSGRYPQSPGSCAADKDVRYYLRGVLIDTTVEGRVHLVTTDGHRMLVVGNATIEGEIVAGTNSTLSMETEPPSMPFDGKGHHVVGVAGAEDVEQRQVVVRGGGGEHGVAAEGLVLDERARDRRRASAPAPASRSAPPSRTAPRDGGPRRRRGGCARGSRCRSPGRPRRAARPAAGRSRSGRTRARVSSIDSCTTGTSASGNTWARTDHVPWSSPHCWSRPTGSGASRSRTRAASSGEPGAG